MHCTLFAVHSVSDKVNKTSAKTTFISSCLPQHRAHLHLFSDPSMSSISLSIFSCSTTLTFCKERNKTLMPHMALTTLTYSLHLYFTGGHQELFQCNYPTAELTTSGHYQTAAFPGSFPKADISWAHQKLVLFFRQKTFGQSRNAATSFTSPTTGRVTLLSA